MSNCKQCGKCCVDYVGTLQATYEDIQRWKKEKRYDILKLVDMFLGDLWIKETKEGLLEASERCPFLRKVKNQNKYICRIHKIKPECCRSYPNNECHKGICDYEKDIKIPKSTKWG